MKVRTTHKDISSGAARLLSARTLKRMLKCNNERNPYSALYVSRKTAWDNQEEGGDDTKSAWPFDTLGCTRGTMGPTMGCQSASWS
jgi:hypothetical protein